MSTSTKRTITRLAMTEIALQLARGWRARQQRQEQPARRVRGAAHHAGARLKHLSRVAPERLPDRVRWDRRSWPARHRAPVAGIAVAGLAAAAAGVAWLTRSERGRRGAERLAQRLHDTADDVPEPAALAADTAAAGLGAFAARAVRDDRGLEAAVSDGIGASMKAAARRHIDDEITAPAKRKALKLGSIGVLSFTAYLLVVVIAAVVIAQLIV